MIRPVRCFSCGKEISSKFDEFTAYKENGMKAGDALDLLGMKRYCCRRMYLGHVELCERLLKYQSTKRK